MSGTGVVGRDHELAHVAAMLEGARRGAGGSLVIRGDPGVGKTALLVHARAKANDFAVLSATGVQSESELPFGALQTLLTPVRGDLHDLPSPQGHALRAALGLADPPVDRLACYAGVLSVLAKVAVTRPLLIVADDVQWFDAESREALVFAARRLTSDPIVCWLSLREGEISGSLGGLPELVLRGLTESASAELLTRHGRQASRSVTALVWAQTAGNPLALVELGDQLTDAQLAGSEPLVEPLPVGRRLEDAFWRQAAALPDSSRNALLVAACSYTNAMDTITAALDRLGLSAVDLTAAEKSRLVSIGNGALAWRHPLARSAVYQRAAASDRRTAHAALAAASGEARLVDHRAWHLAAAATGPDATVASALDSVAREAARRGALPTAIRGYEQAARLSPTDNDRAGRELLAADYAAAVGHWQEALSLVESAESHSAEPCMRARGDQIRARVSLLMGAPAVWNERLIKSAEGVLEIDRLMAAMLMTEAVVPNMATGDARAYMKTASRALELAEPLGGPIRGAAATLLAAGLLVWGQSPKTRPTLESAAQSVEDPAVWHSAPEIAGLHALCSAVMEDFDAAERLLDLVVEGSRRTGAIRSLFYPLANRALVGFRLGRWPSALADAHEAVELCGELPDSAMLAYTRGVLALIEAGLGNVSSAWSLAAESISAAEGLRAFAIVPWAAGAIALLALSQAQPEAAVRSLEQIHPQIAEGTREPGWYAADAMRIEALLRAGARADAEQRLSELRLRARSSCGSWARAVAARCEGLLASEREFDNCFQTALDWHARAPLPFERAWTELCYGERLRRARRRADAREPLARAAATFRTLGAKLWLERTEAELAAAGQRVRTRDSPSPWPQLTGGETRVAQQIIEGATYEEAAAALFVSPRTVEAHLRQMYRKLGVRSRTELTRLLTSHPIATHN